MFLGIFIVIAGTLALLEKLGIIPDNFQWGWPLFIICIGLSIIYDNFTEGKHTNKKDKSDNF